MKGKKKIRRRYAYMLGSNAIVIDVTPQEYGQIVKGDLGIEKVKQDTKYTVYRVKK